MATVKNSLTERKATFSNFLTGEGVQKQINSIMGGVNGQRFMTAMLSVVSNNPKIAECEHSSILSSALIGESLKLSSHPSLGQYFIVPFNDFHNQRKVATFQLGYKGYIQLALRSGVYKKLNVVEVKEGEYVSYNKFTEDFEYKYIEDDEAREAAPTAGYYAMFEYMNGFTKSLYWSKKKMELHAKKYSKAYENDIKKGTSYSFWTTDFDGQGLKTMIRQLISRWGVMSVDLQKAFEADSEIIETNVEVVKEEKQVKTKTEPTKEELEKEFAESAKKIEEAEIINQNKE